MKSVYLQFTFELFIFLHINLGTSTRLKNRNHIHICNMVNGILKNIHRKKWYCFQNRFCVMFFGCLPEQWTTMVTRPRILKRNVIDLLYYLSLRIYSNCCSDNAKHVIHALLTNPKIDRQTPPFTWSRDPSVSNFHKRPLRGASKFISFNSSQNLWQV
jgi:hypothetical protein